MAPKTLFLNESDGTVNFLIGEGGMQDGCVENVAP
jgi:hypothetical protein